MARLLVLVVALVTVFVNSIQLSQATIGADLQSTLKIGRAMCAQNTQGQIDKFFGCYSHAPGKQQFVTCQKRVYGMDLSTTDGVAQVCGNRGKIALYAGCLRQEFQAAGVNMYDAVGQVNKCQAYVLGVE